MMTRNFKLYIKLTLSKIPFKIGLYHFRCSNLAAENPTTNFSLKKVAKILLKYISN